MLVQDMHFAALLALQGQDLEKILARHAKSQKGMRGFIMIIVVSF